MEFNFAQTPSGFLIGIIPALANRHGLIAGATGTGKTVTVQRLVEEFSRAGIPVFITDVKGDLSGVSMAGSMSAKMYDRLSMLKMGEPAWEASPTIFWDLWGKTGHPIRTSISKMGPLLLSRLMDLNETQHSVMQILFKIADDQELNLIDMKDIHSLVTYVQNNLGDLKPQYGHLSSASLGTIHRSLLALEERGADLFFGEPALDVEDLLKVNDKGRGYLNILMADKLMQNPVIYSTLLLWLLSEVYEELPEVGDLEKPKLVMVFDEAHLLFKDTPKALLEKIELVVRLIRSKGVGIYFATQNPMDIPVSVLGQLSHRIQHALKAFTPVDQKVVRTVAQTLRSNKEFDTEEVMTQLGVGEALVSVLDEKGSPTEVQRAWILPPFSRIGVITEEERKKIMEASPYFGRYEKPVETVSAFEKLQNFMSKKKEQKKPVKEGNALNDFLFGTVGPRGGKKTGFIEKTATSLGKDLVRGLLGSFKKR